ncbi:MAG: hypothetical protein AABY22_20830, partial [Nanoarchaeota archaeon]
GFIGAIKRNSESIGLDFNPHGGNNNKKQKIIRGQQQSNYYDENNNNSDDDKEVVHKKRDKEYEKYVKKTQETYGYNVISYQDALINQSFQQVKENEKSELQQPELNNNSKVFYNSEDQLVRALGEQIFDEPKSKVAVSVLSTTSLLLLTFAWYRASEYLFEKLSVAIFGEASHISKNPVTLAIITTIVILIVHEYFKRKEKEKVKQLEKLKFFFNNHK